MKRLPNGYGSVVCLGNNRRKPFAVRKTAGYDDNGKQKYTYVDYYSTKEDALQALIELNKAEISLDDINITFEQVFRAWYRDSGIDKKSKSTQDSYNVSFNHSKEIHQMKMRKLKKRDLQAVINSNMEKGLQTKGRIQTLFISLFDYAIDNDICVKNYAKNLELGEDNAKKNPHKVIPIENINALFAYGNKDLSDILLILLYTGMRINELLKINIGDIHLDESYMTGGNKTKAGKGRVIPIADTIKPIIQARMSGEYLFINKYNNRMTADNIRDKINKADDKLKIDVAFHDTRHTFTTACKNLGIEKPLYQKILGHKGKDVTEDVYTHYTLDEMLNVVNKLDAEYNDFVY